MTVGWGACQAAAEDIKVVWNLSEDWSDLHNPSGDWTYADGEGNPISQRVENYLPGDLGDGQSAWANDPSGVPGWAKGTGNSPHDFPAGIVMSHGSARIAFTAPAPGNYTISGGGWMLRHIGRQVTWNVWLNGKPLTQGTQDDQSTYSSKNPEPWSSGSGGAAVLTQTLAAGDVLLFGHEGPDFFAYDITIEATGGPELSKTPAGEAPRYFSFQGKLDLPVDLVAPDGTEIPKGDYSIEVRTEGEGYALLFSKEGKVVASAPNTPVDPKKRDPTSFRIPVFGTVYLSQDDPAKKVTRSSAWHNLSRPWRAALRAYSQAGESQDVYFVFQRVNFSGEPLTVEFAMRQR